MYKTLSNGLVALVTLCLIITCQDKQSDKEIDISLKDYSLTEVKITSVTEKSFEYFISVPGKIRSKYEAIVINESLGHVTSINYRNGDFVRSGEIVAQIENERELLALERAEIFLKEKQLAFEDAKLSYNGIRDSAKMNSILSNLSLISGLTAAELNVRESKLNLSKTNLRSPISGVLSSLKLKQYNPISANQIAFIIYNPDTLLIDCLVTEDDAVLLKENLKADCILTGGNTAFTAKLLNVNPRVDEVKRLVEVTLAIDGIHKFFPGMSTHVTMKIPLQKCLVIPKEGIVIKSGKSVVFTFENGNAKWNYVKTGRENGSEIEVVEGLKILDKVIITNNLQLSHESPVKLINDN